MTQNNALRWERSYCPYCGVGCGLRVGLGDAGLIKIKGDPDHPANFGEICAKAAHLVPTTLPNGRLLHPYIRERRDGLLKPASWHQALAYAAARLRGIVGCYGPDSVAFYGSGQLTTEDYYVFNKLVKGYLGTNNFDTNSRLCMASAAAAYTAAFGTDGPPASYEDLELADLFLIVGSNTAWCHPITYRRIERRKESAPEQVRVVVVDPRRTETVDLADLHLPILPGSDLALFNAILGVLIRERQIDEEFIAANTNGWAAARAVALDWTVERASDVCRVPAEEILRTALWFGRAERPLTLWSMGVNQSSSGTAKAIALLNLHLATGKIGKPGCGPLALTGQPNAMGGREVGGLSHLLPGYRRVENPSHRAEVERLWETPPGRISPRAGLSAVQVFESLARGTIKAVWIISTNPAVSMPDLDLVERALRYAHLVVVQDSYHPTDTTKFADILLPAAQWPEKEGVMTNSERRLSLLPRLLPAPGEALPDWEIAALLARHLGFSSAFGFADAESVFEEYKRLTAGTPVDLSGISYERLRAGPLQWPCPASDHPGTPRLYIDSRFNTADGRARFHPTEHRAPAEIPDPHFPLILTTGRVRNQWHTMTRTGRVPALMKAAPEPYLEINTQDAAEVGVIDGTFVEVRSRRGVFIAQARVTAEIPAGVCFAPFHWGRGAGQFKAANNLTQRMLDPISQQPEIKFCAVNIVPVRDFPESVFATASFETPAQEARSTFEALAAIEVATPQPPASAK
ncbi:MAG: nitrate reductase [Deltaproteobacteria bacterium]|nr:nitrate reductase [Deltaproteobacteria bacterium]